VEISDYIAKDNLRAAQEFVRKIRSRCDLLRRTPLMAPAHEEFGQNARAFTYRSYMVIYRYDSENDRVDVLRFWHGRRQPPDIGQLE
jgi:plasmid stabilization system protein ParE